MRIQAGRRWPSWLLAALAATLLTVHFGEPASAHVIAEHRAAAHTHAHASGSGHASEHGRASDRGPGCCLGLVDEHHARIPTGVPGAAIAADASHLGAAAPTTAGGTRPRSADRVVHRAELQVWRH